MEEGSIRFDANVSVRPHGSETLGTKVEIKNMNSFRSLERAIASEIERQIHALEAGENLIQETRHWDEEAGVTHGLRTKEGSSDYRYFTEPDLVPLAPSTKTISKLQADLPELPADRRRRYASHGLDPHLVTVLAGADRGVRDLFAATVDLGADPIATTNWLTGEATAIVRRRGIPIEETGLSASRLKDLLQLVAEGLLSASAAKDVLGRVIDDEGEPRAIAESHDLLQVTDEAWIAEAVAQVIDANPDATDRFRAGEEKVVGFLVGQVMRATGGKADPQAVNRLLREQLSALA
jgi:aspartyl-tRNA(Asn)/glutamyl-tRNA(Gln) amidotransferase subunit B